MTPTARLVLGEGAAAARRQLGPTSWAALEVLVDLSDDGACRVVTSVRDVADQLGLSKNAAHRAIRRLVDAGLVAPTQERATDGRFLVGAYRLDVRTEVLHRATEVPRTSTDGPSPTTRRTAPTRRRLDDGAQLTLLTP